MMNWKTWAKRYVEQAFGVRIYRNSLPRGVSFSYDARSILVPNEVAVIFDVGANIGQTAERYNSLYHNARILCFEPVLATYHELERQTGKWGRVETYRLAFGASNSRQPMHINGEPDSSVNSFVNSFDGNAVEMVDITTLDAFCAKHKIQQIDILKVDVEGFELEVLQGAQRMLREHRVKSLYLESTVRARSYHKFALLAQIDARLAEMGYDIFGIYDQEPDAKRKIDHLYYFNVAYLANEALRDRQREVG